MDIESSLSIIESALDSNLPYPRNYRSNMKYNSKSKCYEKVTNQI